MGRRRSSKHPDRTEAAVEELVGPLEAACLRALWESAPATVEQVRSAVNASQGTQLAYTTVMTVLSRLYGKGFLERRRQGRGYRYEPAYTETELAQALARRKVDELVERYGDVALAQFAQTLQRRDPELLERVMELAGEGDDDR